MHSDNYLFLDKITSSYVIKADILFRTIIFQNIAISHANEETNPQLYEAYTNLECFLEKHSPEISDKGIRHDLITKHMPSLCFSSLVSAFEDYIIEIMKLTFRINPEKLNKIKCDYGVFKSLSEDELFDYLVNEGVASLTFGSPKEYINKLCKLLCLDKKKIEHLLKQYIEIKARRDTGVHNNWVKDQRYEKKLLEAGISSEEKEYLIPDLDYFRYSFNLCGKLVKLISNNFSTQILKEQKLFDNE